MQNTEPHPFEPFVPPGIKFLLIGSFPGKEHTQKDCDNEAWYYGAKRNQFWKILGQVYGRDLKTKQDKQDLFKDISMGVTDIIKSCIRRDDSNLDTNLISIEYNDQAISKILSLHQCTVVVTSRFVERAFRKLFPDHSRVVALPSPSPRYAKLGFDRKVEVYRDVLARLRSQL